MKRNFKALAFVLALALMASFPGAAFAGEIEGDGTVQDVAINVLVPTTLDFVLDPLEITENETQVAPQDFFFVNETFAPVKVELEITATASNNAVLVADDSGLEPDDDTVKDKEIFFMVQGASELTGEAIEVNGTVTTDAALVASTTAIYAIDETKVSFVPDVDGETASATIAFALDKAIQDGDTDDVDSLAANDKGVAAFQFAAVMNTYAEWEDNDLSVKGVYSLVPLRPNTYTGYDMIEDSLNQIQLTAPEPPAPPAVGFTGEVNPLVKNIAVASITDTQLVINFNFGDKTLTKIATGSGGTVAAENYTVGADKITFSEARTTIYKEITASTLNTIHLSDGTTYKINFVK